MTPALADPSVGARQPPVGNRRHSRQEHQHVPPDHLRHLFIAGEMLGPILLSIHNLTYYQRLLAEAREAIDADVFVDFVETKQKNWRSASAQEDTAS